MRSSRLWVGLLSPPWFSFSIAMVVWGRNGDASSINF